MTRSRFIELISSEQEALRRFLLALCLGNRDEAEEIAQETMIKAYIASGNFIEKYKFSTWLTKIAYNTFLDRRKKKRNENLTPLYEKIEDYTKDPKLEYEDLYHALGSLPEKEKTSLLLFYIQGFSIKEISVITNCSENAVKTQLSRGREKLKTKMKSER